MSSKFKLVFFGTSILGIPSLRLLAQSGFSILVVTQPDQPSGREQALAASPIKTVAQELGLPVLQPNSLRKDSADIAAIRAFAPEVGVVISYAKILPQSILDIPPKGILNLHPSLLPKYRGPSPIQAAIANQDSITGITVMLLDAEMDHGPILSQTETSVQPSDTYATLHARCAEEGAPLLLSALEGYLNGEMLPQPQDHALATFTSIIQREDGLIDWKQSASSIAAKLRAYTPWPGVFTTWNGKRLKLLELHVVEESLPELSQAPGSVGVDSWKSPVVRCGAGLLRLSRLQLEGKKEVSGIDFIRGYSGFLGSRLG